ncbi:MAG: hypothetical protein AB1489_32255 [Acidobacteriota bacterium]
MVKTSTLICCLTLSMAYVLSVSPALASGGSGGAISAPRAGASDAFTPTKSVRATLIKIDEEKQTITVKDNKGQELTLTLNKKTKYRAEDSKQFDGRKDLQLSDLTADIDVKVVYQQTNSQAIEIKVLKKR